MAAGKLERLLNLTALLLNTSRPLTADEIRQGLEVYPEGQQSFRRAFERDKEELRAMGIPLAIEKVLGPSHVLIDAYRILPEEYFLRDPELAPDEIAALHLAASAVQVEGLSPSGAFTKLGAAVGASPGGDLGVRIAPLPADPNLGRLFAAVSSRTPVQLRYRGEDRTIDPYRLELQRGRWYLTGYDHLREGERNYRLDRVEGDVSLTDLPAFDPPSTPVAGQSRKPWELGAEEPVVATVRIEGPGAQWARQHLGADKVTEVGEGVVEAKLPVTQRAAFRTFVLSFLEHAEVVDPPELRAEIVEWLESLA